MVDNACCFHLFLFIRRRVVRVLHSEFQHLEEALYVTAGAGAAGIGNPAYVLERLRVLAEDDFMSAFVYDKGGG